ncbi:unnamed protein product [Closterium sp. NIES-64]|nr:unnamed protein product [Closterium sp. NIES-64]
MLASHHHLQEMAVSGDCATGAGAEATRLRSSAHSPQPAQPAQSPQSEIVPVGDAGSGAQAQAQALDPAEKRLLELGYRQELKRRLGWLEIFGVSAAVMNPYMTAVPFFGFALLQAGPVGVVWPWVVLAPFALCMVLVIAEVCSSFPTSGSLYFWAASLSPPRWKPLVAWVTVWLEVIALSVCASSIAFPAAQLVQMMVHHMASGEHLASTAFFFALYCALLLSWALLNSLSLTCISRLLDCYVYFAVAYTITIVTVLPAVAVELKPPSFIFLEYQSGCPITGVCSLLPSLILAGLLPHFSFYGFDSAAHVTEETRNSDVSGPRAILGSFLVQVVFGFAILVTFTACIQGDYRTLFTAEGSSFMDPVVHLLISLFTARYGSATGAYVLLFLMVIHFYAAGFGVTLASSRAIYAASRDGAMPWSRVWRTLSRRNRIPVRAIWLSTFIAIIFGVPSFFSPTFFGTVAAVTSAAWLGTYGIVVFFRLIIPPHRFKPGPFSLGRCARPLCVVALGYIVYTIGVFMAPIFYPITWETFNYAPIALRYEAFSNPRAPLTENVTSLRADVDFHAVAANGKPKGPLIIPLDSFVAMPGDSPTTFGNQIENTMRWEEFSITQAVPNLWNLAARDSLDGKQLAALPAAALTEGTSQPAAQPADGQKVGGKRQLPAEGLSPTRCSPRLKKRQEIAALAVSSSPRPLFAMSPPASPKSPKSPKAPRSPKTSKVAESVSPRRSPRNHAKSRLALKCAGEVAESHGRGKATAAASPAAASPKPGERANRRVNTRCKDRRNFEEWIQKDDGLSTVGTAAEDAKKSGGGNDREKAPVEGKTGEAEEGKSEPAAVAGIVRNVSAGKGSSGLVDPAHVVAEKQNPPMAVSAMSAATPEGAAGGEQAAAACDGVTPEEAVARSGLLSSFLSPGLDDVKGMGLGFSLTPVDKSRAAITEPERGAVAVTAAAAAAAEAAGEGIAPAPEQLMSSFLTPGVLDHSDGDLDGLLETPDGASSGVGRRTGGADWLDSALLGLEKGVGAAGFAGDAGSPLQLVGEAVALDPLPRVPLDPPQECAPLRLESALNAALLLPAPLAANDQADGAAAVGKLSGDGAFGSPQDRIAGEGGGGEGAEGGAAGSYGGEGRARESVGKKGRRESTGTSPEPGAWRESGKEGGGEAGDAGEAGGRVEEMAGEEEAATEFSTIGRFPYLTARPAVTASVGGMAPIEAGTGAEEMETPPRRVAKSRSGGGGAREAEGGSPRDGDSPIMGVVSAGKEGAGGSARQDGKVARSGGKRGDAEDGENGGDEGDAEERSMGLVGWSEGVRRAFEDVEMGEELVGGFDLAEVGWGEEMAGGVGGGMESAEQARIRGVRWLEWFFSMAGVSAARGAGCDVKQWHRSVLLCERAIRGLISSDFTLFRDLLPRTRAPPPQMSLEKRKSGVLEQSPWTPRTPRERAGEASAGERLFRRVCLQPQEEAVEKLCAELLARVAEEQQQTDALEAAMTTSSTALAQLAAQGNPEQQKVLKERLLALKSLLRMETKAEWQRVRTQLEAERSRALDHAERMLQVEQHRVTERRAAEEAAARRVGELLADVRARRAAAERALKEREEKAAAHQQSRLQELRQQRQRLLEETDAMRRELAARHEALQARCQPMGEPQMQTQTRTQSQARIQLQPQTVAQPAPGTAEEGGFRAAAGKTGVEGAEGENTGAVSDPVRAAKITEFLQGWRLREYQQSQDGTQMDLVLSVLHFVTLRVHIDLATSSFSLSPAINHSVVAKQFPLFEVVPAMEALVVGPTGGSSQPRSSPLTAAALAAAYQGVLLRAGRTHALVQELWEQRQQLMRVMPCLTMQPYGTSGDVVVRASFVQFDPFTKVILSCRIPYQISGMSYPFMRPHVEVEVPHSRKLPAQQVQHAVAAAAAGVPEGYGLMARMLQAVAGTLQTLIGN